MTVKSKIGLASNIKIDVPGRQLRINPDKSPEQAPPLAPHIPCAKKQQQVARISSRTPRASEISNPPSLGNSSSVVPAPDSSTTSEASETTNSPSSANQSCCRCLRWF